MRNMQQHQHFLDSLEGAHRRSVAAGIPRAALAFGVVSSVNAAILLIRRMIRKLGVFSIRRTPATATN